MMRTDTQSEEKELNHLVRCYNCQREAKKQVKTFYATRPGEKYRGNLEVKKETPRQNNYGHIYWVTECYTGKYVMKFGNFCSVKCGLIWANNEIERRRMNKNTNGSGNAIKPEDKDQLMKLRNQIAMNGRARYAKQEKV